MLALISWADHVARFSPRLIACLTAVALLHLAGGLLPPVDGNVTFYETWLIPGMLKFDQVVHAFGSGVLTVACARLAVAALKAHAAPRGGTTFVGALMAMGLGALNELVEFLFGLSDANVHAGGLDNVGWDLAFNLAGAIAAALWLATAPRETSTAMSDFRQPTLLGDVTLSGCSPTSTAATGPSSPKTRVSTAGSSPPS